jgi:hypothetical protein
MVRVNLIRSQQAAVRMAKQEEQAENQSFVATAKQIWNDLKSAAPKD